MIRWSTLRCDHRLLSESPPGWIVFPSVDFLALAARVTNEVLLHFQLEFAPKNLGSGLRFCGSHLAECNDHAELLKQSVALVENRKIAGVTPRTVLRADLLSSAFCVTRALIMLESGHAQDNDYNRSGRLSLTAA